MGTGVKQTMKSTAETSATSRRPGPSSIDSSSTLGCRGPNARSMSTIRTDIIIQLAETNVSAMAIVTVTSEIIVERRPSAA
jgi:hypothetical protein